jgi:signal transduction histidine kinase
VARDITERHRFEDQLRQAQKMEAIGTLAGGIAHDFNNILAAIVGFTEMAVEDITDRPDVQKSLQNVLKSAIRARELVKQILAFSRKTEHERNPLSLSPVIKETMQLVRASIPAMIDIKVSLATTSDLVLASPVEVQQIIMNLATNATLAMQEKGGTLRVSLTHVESDPGMIQHVVSDTVPV